MCCVDAKLGKVGVILICKMRLKQSLLGNKCNLQVPVFTCSTQHFLLCIVHSCPLPHPVICFHFSERIDLRSVTLCIFCLSHGKTLLFVHKPLWLDLEHIKIKPRQITALLGLLALLLLHPPSNPWNLFLPPHLPLTLFYLSSPQTLMPILFTCSLFWEFRSDICVNLLMHSSFVLSLFSGLMFSFW